MSTEYNIKSKLFVVLGYLYNCKPKKIVKNQFFAVFSGTGAPLAL